MAATRDIDLWALATMMTETRLPPASDSVQRDAHRLSRARRPWLLAGGSLALAAAIAAGVSIFVFDEGWRPVLSPAMALLLIVAAAAFASVVSADTFRRASRAFVIVTQIVWWSSVVGTFIFCVAGLACATIAAAAEAIAGDAEAAVALRSDYGALALMSCVLATMCALMCSSAAQPLVSTSRPRLWQQSWALVAWTAALSALIVTACIVVVPATNQWTQWSPAFDATGLIVGIGLALVTAVFAWHIRNKERLSGERRAVLVLLERAARDDYERPSERVDALARLQEAVTVDPFRSQSPAALPTVAGDEIGQVVDAMMAASRGAALPPAWERRTALPGSIGEDFSTARDTFRSDPPRFVRAGTTVLRRCHDELLRARRAK